MMLFSFISALQQKNSDQKEAEIAKNDLNSKIAEYIAQYWVSDLRNKPAKMLWMQTLNRYNI